MQSHVFFVFSSKSGVTDHYAQDDSHALYLARNIIKNINYKKDPQVSYGKKTLLCPQHKYRSTHVRPSVGTIILCAELLIHQYREYDKTFTDGRP